MKGLLLATASVVALGFGATAAMAGGSSVYDSQDGTGQNAFIDQSSGTNDSVGGLGNPFIQNNGAGTGGNSISITQVGSNNSFGKNMSSFQSGTDNRANVLQNGTNSDVELQQTGSNNGANNVYEVHGYWYNDNDGGLIEQDSTTNHSSVSLSQNGNNNAFNIGQGGTGNSVSATQTGDNLLWIRQGTNSPDNWDSSELAVTGPATNSTITVSQNGGYFDNTGNYDNYAALSQGGGNRNQMTVTQFGNANSIDVNQSGSNNTLTSYQSGFGNFLGGEQGWPVPDGGVPIVQSGSNNYVYNYQLGTSNMVFGSQIGNNNQVSSTQNGNYDTLYYTQTSSNNTISNTQGGSSNTVTIHQ
jgi:hypothetical protein